MVVGLGNKAAELTVQEQKKLNIFICSFRSKKPSVVLKGRHERTKEDWSITAEVLLFSTRTKI